MPVCILNKCCFCVPLKTGCYIIGFFYLILVLLQLVLVIVTWAKNEDVDLKEVILKLIYCIVSIGFCIILLIGLHKDNPMYVKAFLYYCYISLVLSVAAVIFMGVTGINIGILSGSIISILMSLYFILVIRSYYYELEGE